LGAEEAAVLTLLRSRLKTAAHRPVSGAERLRKQLTGSVTPLRRPKPRRRDMTRHVAPLRRKNAHPKPRAAEGAASLSR
jgi:hypothetical protein